MFSDTWTVVSLWPVRLNADPSVVVTGPVRESKIAVVVDGNWNTVGGGTCEACVGFSEEFVARFC